jgi:hypothetical protein
MDEDLSPGLFINYRASATETSPGHGHAARGFVTRVLAACNVYQMTSRPLPRQDPFACEDVQLHYRNVKYQQRPGEWYHYSISQLARPRPPLP